MAVLDQTPNDESDVTSSDVIAFFDTKGVPSRCELCGTASWSIASQVEGARPRLRFYPTQDRIGVGGIDLLVLNCDNCGNLRLFNRYHFNRWLADRGEDADA